jgi:LPXTG-motif cell wall-anchored protein
VLRSRLAALTVALVLAAPGAALAQSAGDEQYQDPFGNDQEQPQPTPQPDTPSSSSDDAGTTAQATPTPAATAPAPTATTATTAQASVGQEQLPRTGADAGLIALGGAVLLVGGVALRRRVSGDAGSA